MNQLFLHCRIGFEKECAAEIADLAAQYQIQGYPKTVDQSAFVIFHCFDEKGALHLQQIIPFQRLIFARQWFVTSDLLKDLPLNDRVTALIEAAKKFPKVKDIIVETLDTNEGKELSVLGKKITGPFVQALKKNQQMDAKSDYQLHLLFVQGTAAYVGVSLLKNSSAWPGGIIRLRLPKEAPSRATLKLEEAWHHFIPAAEWDKRLAPGMRAVDLGAAPGGWTWQLVRRSIYVDAVDNGPMQKELMDSGLVTQYFEDGFVFEPKKKVDWLVCDIVDKPARAASLIVKWIGKNLCREAVFNLKLPMKQRYLEVKKCETKICDDLSKLGVKVELQFKQLYHDREEVTGHIRRIAERQ